MICATVWLGAVATSPAYATPAAMGEPRSTVPAGAFVLPPDRKSELQSAIDAHHIVVLQAGDYAKNGPASITLHSDDQLYGDAAGSIIPAVIVAPGTKGAVLDHFRMQGPVTFPASPEVTRNNRFQNLIGFHMVAIGATLEDNLFLDDNGSIMADTGAGGYLRNNRFIRCRAQSVSPMITLLGDAGRSSYGNVFLWYNFLTPHHNASLFTNQGDLSFVGSDSEGWNLRDKPDTANATALFKTGPMGTLRIFSPNGGNHYSGKRTGDFDMAADEFQLYNDLIGPDQPPNVVLEPTCVRSLNFCPRSPKDVTDLATDAFRIVALDPGSGDPRGFLVNGTSYSNPLPAGLQAKLRAMLVNPKRNGEPWEAPTYGKAPDPAGTNWNKNLSGKTDSTVIIQGMIDNNPDHIARLPAGIYYISSSLKLGRNQGIVGASADTTALVALNPAIDLIVGSDPPTQATGTNIILADLTLQGGANGIHFDKINTSTGQGAAPNGGRRAQYTNMYVSHVAFRNMTNAGICMDQIYGLDNNFLGYLYFINCGTALLQITDPTPHPEAFHGDFPTLMYMDKTVFYRSQFIGNRVALSLKANRANNLNAWIECLFQDNSDGAVVLKNNSSDLFANCDFINNGGHAAVTSNDNVSFVSCRFQSGANGVALLEGPVSAEGCQFAQNGSTKATILAGKNRRISFYDCKSTDVPLGPLAGTSGIFVNSALPDTSLSQQVVLLKDGSARTLVPGKPDPRPQLLFGSRLQN